MRLGWMGSPSRGCSTTSLVCRLRMFGSAVAEWGPMWSTMKTAAGRSSGRSPTNWLSASTPPADAPPTMMSCPPIGLSLSLIGWDASKPTPFSALGVPVAATNHQQAEHHGGGGHGQLLRFDAALPEPVHLPLGLEAGADLLADGIERFG